MQSANTQTPCHINKGEAHSNFTCELQRTSGTEEARGDNINLILFLLLQFLSSPRLIAKFTGKLLKPPGVSSPAVLGRTD
jgi:hypothetical protein